MVSEFLVSNRATRLHPFCYYSYVTGKFSTPLMCIPAYKLTVIIFYYIFPIKTVRPTDKFLPDDYLRIEKLPGVGSLPFRQDYLLLYVVVNRGVLCDLFERRGVWGLEFTNENAILADNTKLCFPGN